MKAYSHLSAQERIRIDELRNRDGLGVCQIALRMGRGKSAVSREPGRGPWFASDENGSYRPYRPKRLKAGVWTSRPFYSAMTAQHKAEQRARQPRKPMRMAYDPLLEWVMDTLRKGWTPELIEGRLKVEWPADPHMRISHECLHQWIRAKPRRALDLRRYLPRGKRHRTRARGGRSKGSRIPMRVPIVKRPKRVDPRREFGHYESDTAVGSAPSRRCIDTQVERKSRRLFARFIPDKGAPATARAGRSHRIRGRGCSGPGHRIRARHAPGLHDPVDAAARHDDALMFQGGLDPPGPVHPAAVAPHASHILLMGVGPFGLGVVEHPVVCRLRHAQDPALRRYRAAAGIGPYHACFRANTGAACSETSTSISNRRLRLLNAISSFRSGVWLSTALVEPLLRIPRAAMGYGRDIWKR